MPRTYYVATDGSGDFSSISQVNAANLQSGDIVKFRAGDTFEGGLRGQRGVTYESYGEGEKPIITNPGGTGFRAAEDSTIADVQIVETGSYGVFIDKIDNVTVRNVDFDYNCLNSPGNRTIAAFHADNVVIEGNTLGRSGGVDHIYAYNTQDIVIRENDITWLESHDGDGIQVAASQNYYIGHNTLEMLGGNKGAIIVLPDNKYLPEGGVVEYNDVTGGQFGIAVRQENAVVQNNIIRDVGNQPHSASWSTGIWISTGNSEHLDVSGMVFQNNVIINTQRAIGSWDNPDDYTTGYEIRNNVIINAEDKYFFRDNGAMKGGFYDNLIVDSGHNSISVSTGNWESSGNYFYNVDGERNSGGNPAVNGEFFATNGSVNGAGLTAGAKVGPQTAVTERPAPEEPGLEQPGEPEQPGEQPDPAETHEVIVRLAGEAYRGDPEYTILVNGKEIASGTVDWALSDNLFDPENDDHWRELSFTVEGDAPQSVEVVYSNDAWGGSPEADRNLWVDWVEVNGTRFAADGPGTSYRDGAGQKDLAEKGTLTIDTSSATAPERPAPEEPQPEPTEPEQPEPEVPEQPDPEVPGEPEVPTDPEQPEQPEPVVGLNEIVVRLGGEAWEGDPNYTILVDGEEIASGVVDWARPAAHFDPENDNQWRELTFEYEGEKPESVQVVYSNDATGVTPETDRNLWVDWVEVNGTRFEAEGPNAAHHHGLGFDEGQEKLGANGWLAFDTSDAAEPATALAALEADDWAAADGDRNLLLVDETVDTTESLAFDDAVALDTTLTDGEGEDASVYVSDFETA